MLLLWNECQNTVAVYQVFPSHWKDRATWPHCHLALVARDLLLNTGLQVSWLILPQLLAILPSFRGFISDFGIGPLLAQAAFLFPHRYLKTCQSGVFIIHFSLLCCHHWTSLFQSLLGENDKKQRILFPHPFIRLEMSRKI